MASFQEILNKPAASVEKPKPYPVGTYICLVDGPFKDREVNQQPVIDFMLKPLQPKEDVDQAALAGMGGLGRPIRHTIFLMSQDGQPTDYNLLRFLEDHLGIEKGDKTLSQMAAEAPGKQVLATLKHNPSKDGTEMYANVAATAKV